YVGDSVISHRLLLAVAGHTLKLLKGADCFFGISDFCLGAGQVIIELGVIGIGVNRFFKKGDGLLILSVVVSLVCVAGVFGRGTDQQKSAQGNKNISHN